MIENTTPDASLLREAVQGILKEAREARGQASWTELEQSQFLSAVQLSLIAGDVVTAKDSIQWRKPFKATHHYYDWLKAFVLALPEVGGPGSAAVDAHFDALFDKVRDPDWASPKERDSGWKIMGSRSMLRLQLAMVKQRYILNEPIAGHWREIIDLIVQ